MTNVFVAPGDVFDEIKSRPPSVTNWLVPILLSCLVGVISVWIIFSQDTVLHQLREQQDRAMAPKLEKLSKAERDKLMETVEMFSSPLMTKVFGSIGVFTGSFIGLFLMALLVWGSGRFIFKARFSYLKAVEMCGLAEVILILGAIVKTLLVVSLGNLTAAPNLALAIGEFQPANKLHQIAASCDVVTFWYMSVLAAGLGRLSGVPAWKTFAWLFVLWAALRGLMILSGFAASGM